MGHFGFSYVGLIFLLLLFIPNIIWTKYPPIGYTNQGESRGLALLEKIGQVLTTCCGLVFSDFNLRPWDWGCLWLVGAAGFMLRYECYWVRYFTGPKTLAQFYGRFLCIPLPGAVLPVLAFLCLGLYGGVLWMILSAILLGIGHIGIHWGASPLSPLRGG